MRFPLVSAEGSAWGGGLFLCPASGLLVNVSAVLLGERDGCADPQTLGKER